MAQLLSHTRQPGQDSGAVGRLEIWVGKMKQGLRTQYDGFALRSIPTPDPPDCGFHSNPLRCSDRSPATTYLMLEVLAGCIPSCSSSRHLALSLHQGSDKDT